MTKRFYGSKWYLGVVAALLLASGIPARGAAAPDAGPVVSPPGLKRFDLGGLALSFRMGPRGVFAHVVTHGADPRGTWLRLPILYLSPPSARRVIDGRILIIGEAHGGVATIVVLDSKATKILDSFWCLHPSLSPDLRYLAYTMATEPHGSEPSTDFAAIYDLRAGRAENRVGWKAGAEDIDAGTLLYPRAAKFDPARDVWRGAQHSFGPSYVWSADGSAVSFLDTLGGAPAPARIVATRTGPDWSITRAAR